MGTPYWMAAILIVAAYCIWQTVRDVRRRDYVMAAIGGFCAALLLLTPITTQPIKYDLPAPQAR